jgi:hypothetical protein
MITKKKKELIEGWEERGKEREFYGGTNNNKLKQQKQTKEQ